MTAEIVADLRSREFITTFPDGLYAWQKIDLHAEAADRLAELDAKVERLEADLSHETGANAWLRSVTP